MRSTLTARHEARMRLGNPPPRLHHRAQSLLGGFAPASGRRRCVFLRNANALKPRCPIYLANRAKTTPTGVRRIESAVSSCAVRQPRGSARDRFPYLGLAPNAARTPSAWETATALIWPNASPVISTTLNRCADYESEHLSLSAAEGVVVASQTAVMTSRPT